MRIVAAIAVSLLLAGAANAQQSAEDPNLSFIPAGDPAMARAVKRAQASLPGFLELSRHPKPGMEHFAVKVGLGPKGGEEFFWLSPFSVEGDKLTGALANEPEVVKGYAKGQKVTLPLAEVTDWMYVQDGLLRDNYSACVLYARQGPQALAGFEREYGADCGALK